jgi:hypothetical protein
MEELELIVASVKQEMDAAIKHLTMLFRKSERVELLLLWYRMLW